jgi:hypothetical protein
MSEQENDVVMADSSAAAEDNSESTVESKSVPYERFKEVNEELKRLKQEHLDAVSIKTEQKVAPKPETNTLTEDDILVNTTIQDKDLINTAREIAKLKGISLSEAANSTMFRLAKAEREEEVRQEKVQMEASKGSGSRGKKKDFKTVGLSPAEHKALWKQRTGR